jgi:hypothetical protein
MVAGEGEEFLLFGIRLKSSTPLVAVEFISTPDPGKDTLCRHQGVP